MAAIFTLVSAVPTDKIISGISNIFKNKPSPNDWQGWDALDAKYNSPAGNQAAYWTVNNGNSVPNEALNIIQYLTKKRDGFNLVYQAGLTSRFWMNQSDFIQKLGSKLVAGGYKNEANQLIQQYKDMLAQQAQPQSQQQAPAPPPEKPKSKLIWYVGGGVALLAVGLTIYFVARKK